MQESRTDQTVDGDISVADFFIPRPLRVDIAKNQPTSRKVLLSIVPLTPAPITGPDAWIGWGRLLAYGSLSAMSFNKARKLSYAFMMAGGLSLMTSMAGEAYIAPNVQGAK